MTMMLLLLLAALFAVGVQSVEYSEEETLFREFIVKYAKTYTGAEYQKRLEIFTENLQLANELNSRSPHAQFGVTKFSDLSKQEFRERYLLRNVMNRRRHVPQHNKMWKASAKTEALPTEYDWNNATTKCLTPVYNQQQCGSCWAFSTTESIESQWALAGNPLVSLSMQQIVDCDTSDAGCNGGDPPTAYQYVMSAGGLESYADYPYTAKNGKCKFDATKIVATISNWQWVTQSKDEDAMQQFTYTTGPPSICVDATIWQTYQGGIITKASGCGTALDHCVQITGWFQSGSMAVWNVRNSWGADWGQSGYIWVEKGYDICGIAMEVTSAII